MNVRTILLLAGTIVLETSNASCRPAPSALPPTPAVPQAAQLETPPPPPSPPDVPAPPPRSGRRPPAPPPDPTSAVETTIGGTVRNFSYGPAGDVNGLVLDRGTEIHVPPEQANQLNSLAPIGAHIQARGWIHTGPQGDSHLDATTITNLNNQTSLTFQTPPPPAGPGVPPSPPAPSAPPVPPQQPSASPAGNPSAPPSPESTIIGVVRSFNYGPAGEVDGVVLRQGTVVYFPPEQAYQVMQFIRVGAGVRVRGSLRPGPTGNQLLSANAITNRATGNSIIFASQPLPPLP